MEVDRTATRVNQATLAGDSVGAVERGLWYSRPVNRSSTPRHLLACVTVACLLGGSGCVEKVDSCDRHADFVRAVSDRCVLAWDCVASYPELTAPVAQDLDWCVDCVTARLVDDASDLRCDPAPLSGRPCADVLNETLDSSCFPLDATALP